MYERAFMQALHQELKKRFHKKMQTFVSEMIQKHKQPLLRHNRLLWETSTLEPKFSIEISYIKRPEHEFAE